jgi:hypothetical protein
MRHKHFAATSPDFVSILTVEPDFDPAIVSPVSTVQIFWGDAVRSIPVR